MCIFWNKHPQSKNVSLLPKTPTLESTSSLWNCRLKKKRASHLLHQSFSRSKHDLNLPIDWIKTFLLFEKFSSNWLHGISITFKSTKATKTCLQISCNNFQLSLMVWSHAYPKFEKNMRPEQQTNREKNIAKFCFLTFGGKPFFDTISQYCVSPDVTTWRFELINFFYPFSLLSSFTVFGFFSSQRSKLRSILVMWYKCI